MAFFEHIMPVTVSVVEEALAPVTCFITHSIALLPTCAPWVAEVVTVLVIMEAERGLPARQVADAVVHPGFWTPFIAYGHFTAVLAVILAVSV
jgi:hypothetical protein